MTDWSQVAQAITNMIAAGAQPTDVALLLSTVHQSEPAVVSELHVFDDVPTSRGWQIVVLQRGWVVVGNVTEHHDELTIEDASVIRYWGTTKGLGELRDGPTSKTKLDTAGTVRAHVLAVVLTIDVNPSKWQG